MKKEKTKYVLKSQLPYILVIIPLLLSPFVFNGQDLPTFLSFIILIPIFAYFKFDARIPMVYAVIMLIITASVLGLYKNEIVANLLAIYAYWLLVVGVICLTIEYVREKKGEEDEGDDEEGTD